MGIVFGDKRQSLAFHRLEAEFGIDTEGEKGWVTVVSLVPSSSFLMYLWIFSSPLIAAAVGGLIGVALGSNLLLTIGAILLFVSGLGYLGGKGVVSEMGRVLGSRPAFLAINEERVVIARVTPYRWAVRYVLVDQEPRIGGFDYSGRHTPKRIGLAFLRPSSSPLYFQVSDEAHLFARTSRQGLANRSDPTPEPELLAQQELMERVSVMARRPTLPPSRHAAEMAADA